MIKVSTGLITTEVERDGQPVGKISFNPSNTYFKEKAFKFSEEVTKKQKDWEEIAKEIDGIKEEGAHLAALIKFEKEFFNYFGLIYRDLFGEGADSIVQGKESLDRDATIAIFDSIMTGWVMPELAEFQKQKEAKYGPQKQVKKKGKK